MTWVICYDVLYCLYPIYYENGHWEDVENVIVHEGVEIVTFYQEVVLENVTFQEVAKENEIFALGVVLGIEIFHEVGEAMVNELVHQEVEPENVIDVFLQKNKM